MTPKPMLNTGYKPPVKVISQETSATPIIPAPQAVTTDLGPLRLPANIYMQYDIPDCVENGVCFVKRYLKWKQTGQLTNPCRRELAIRTVANDGQPFADGTNLDSALTVAHFGPGIGDAQYFSDDHQLPEETFIGTMVPEVEMNSDEKIPPFQFLEGYTANDLKSAINLYGLVIIGIKVSDWWWTAPNGQTSWAMDDILPIRPPDAEHPEVSGHCVVLYAYDEQFFYFMNWWSEEWGDQGRGWFGINDLPSIYEAAVVVAYPPETSPDAPGASVSVVAPEPTQSTLLAELEQSGENLLDKIEAVI